MIVSKATKEDLPAIRNLMQMYGNKMIVTEDHLNNRDIALQVRDSDGVLAGFIWGGLMAKNTIMYVDKLAIDPKFARKGVSQFLYKKLLEIAIKMGIRQSFGIIKQDKYHDRSCMNALKMACGADNHAYTYVVVDPRHVLKELESLGV